MPQIPTLGLQSHLDGCRVPWGQWKTGTPWVGDKQSAGYRSRCPAHTPHPTPPQPQQAGKKLPNMKFSFAHLGAGAPVEHFTQDTKSRKAYSEGFRMHTRLSLPRAPGYPALARCPHAAANMHPVPCQAGQEKPARDGNRIPKVQGKRRPESGRQHPCGSSPFPFPGWFLTDGG